MLKEVIKKQDVSTISLITVNLIPLIGILFFHWSPILVLTIYLLESVTIGFYSILKIIASSLFSEKYIPTIIQSKIKNIVLIKILNIFAALIAIPIFCFVYFGFMFIYFISILIVTNSGYPDAINFPQPNQFFLPSLTLFISHGISFITNFIIKKEYKKMTMENSINLPIRRAIIVMYIFLFGAIIVIKTGLPEIILFAFAIVKIITDLIAHNKEHNKFETRIKN